MSEFNEKQDKDRIERSLAGGVEDETLRSILRTWQAPDAPSSLDKRVIAAYRRRTTPPAWRRLFTATIPVPAPVAIVFLAILSVSISLAARALPYSSSQSKTAVTTVDPNKSTVIPADAKNISLVKITSTGPGNLSARGGSQSAAPSRNPGAAGKKSLPANALPVKPAPSVSVITMESDQGTIQCITRGEYRLSTPKIYAGNYFKPSNERQLP